MVDVIRRTAKVDTNMVEIHSNELTDAEAEQYDRQIRLWGLDSQKRLEILRIFFHRFPPGAQFLTNGLHSI